MRYRYGSRKQNENWLKRTVISVTLCVVLLVGMIGAVYVGKTKTAYAATDSINNETAITYTEKQSLAPVLTNIYNSKGSLKILEIVPFEEASSMNVVCADTEVQEYVNAHAEEIFTYYKSRNGYTTEGDYQKVYCGQGGGILANLGISLYVYYNTTDGTYTCEYPNYLLESVIDSDTYPNYYEYFSTHIEVDTYTPAGLQTAYERNSSFLDADGDGAFDYDLVFVSSQSGDRISSINQWNCFLNGSTFGSGTTGTTYSYGSSKINGVYNDISWELAEKLINYIYSGNSHTAYQPVSSIMCIESWVKSNYNISKFCSFMLMSSNDTDSSISMWISSIGAYVDVPNYYQYMLSNNLAHTYTSGWRTYSYTASNGLASPAFYVSGTYYYGWWSRSYFDGYYQTWSNSSFFSNSVNTVISNGHVYNYVYAINDNNYIATLLGLANDSPATYSSTGASDREVGDSGTYTINDILKYMLGLGETEPSTKVISKVKVLEIEPCRDYLYDDLSNLKLLGKYLGFSSYSSWTSVEDASTYIEVTTLATFEYNCMNVDVIADYDIVIIGANTGLMNTNSSGATRYNDSSLNGYVYLAYGDSVVQISDRIGMFTGKATGVSISVARYSDNDLVEDKMQEIIDFADTGKPVVMANTVYSNSVCYPTSNMYNLVSKIASYSNVMNMTSAQTKLLDYVKNDSLSFVSFTVYYDNKGDGDYTNIIPEFTYDSDGIVSEECFVDVSAGYQFNVSFSCTTSSTYLVELLVDKDGNGRFDEEGSYDDDNELLYSKTVTTDENEVLKQISFNMNVADDYNGFLYYKVVVKGVSSNVLNEAVSKTGSIAIKGETTYVNVLQIYPEKSGTMTLDMTGSTFLNYLDEAKKRINFNISISKMVAGDFESIFEEEPYVAYEDADTDLEFYEYVAEYNYLVANYSMVVIGFGDMYLYDDICNDYGAVDAIKDYINAGYSMLLTHDDIYFYKPDNKSEQTIMSEFTIELADLFGMDRYEYYSKLEGSLYDAVYDKNGNEITEAYYGMTNGQLIRWDDTSANTYAMYYSGGYSDGVVNNYSYLANKTNSGQITMYPYNVDYDSIAISATHEQYYQLDLEDDDITVWFTMGSTTNSYFINTQGDGRNNYYIYSKDNITYTGAGHSSITSEAEMQLFVNTIIKAANAGNNIPEITVTNAYNATGSSDYDYIFYATEGIDIVLEYEAYDADLSSREILQNMYSSESEIISHLGRFTRGGITWLRTGSEGVVTNDSVNTAISTFSSSNYIYNGETSTITFAVGSAEYNAVFGTDKGFIDIEIKVRDSRGASDTKVVRIMSRTLFNLD